MLKQMMRHKDPSTTMGYYVELEVQDVAAEIHAGYDQTLAGQSTALGSAGQI